MENEPVQDQSGSTQIRTVLQYFQSDVSNKEISPKNIYLINIKYKYLYK